MTVRHLITFVVPALVVVGTLILWVATRSRTPRSVGRFRGMLIAILAGQPNELPRIGRKRVITIDESKAHTVYHTIASGDHPYGIFISDLDFELGTPYLVMQWTKTPEGKVATVRIEIDRERLEPMPGDLADFLISDSVERPDHISEPVIKDIIEFHKRQLGDDAA